ncbi:MAG: hypothetical protein L6461_18070 [Anaerolineae bacterium]|nr:hypothetical protein [Anaerolineae bacterium]
MVALSGCQQATREQSVEVTAIPLSTPTSTPAVEPTKILPTQTIRPENSQPLKYVKNCLEIDETFANNLEISGNIILIDNNTYTLTGFPFDDNYPSRELESISGYKFLDISPDKKWLVYESGRTGSVISIQGFSLSSDSRIETKISGIEEGSYYTHWLDEERLVLNVPFEQKARILNVFSGEVAEINAYLPDYHIYIWFTPVFSPDLNKMIAYRNLPEEFQSIVLWDLDTASQVWRMEIDFELGKRNLVSVSPNREQVAIAGSVKLEDPFVLDLFLLDWDGNLTQLTHLRDSGFRSGLIEQIQWSPDMRSLAFWLNGSLAVYDFDTQIVTDYCIQSAWSMQFQPYWSPNNRQIVFTGGYTPSPDPTSIIVVDIVEKVAVKILEDEYYVAGWMLP